MKNKTLNALIFALCFLVTGMLSAADAAARQDYDELESLLASQDSDAAETAPARTRYRRTADADERAALESAAELKEEVAEQVDKIIDPAQVIKDERTFWQRAKDNITKYVTSKIDILSKTVAIGGKVLDKAKPIPTEAKKLYQAFNDLNDAKKTIRGASIKIPKLDTDSNFVMNSKTGKISFDTIAAKSLKDEDKRALLVAYNNKLMGLGSAFFAKSIKPFSKELFDGFTVLSKSFPSLEQYTPTAQQSTEIFFNIIDVLAKSSQENMALQIQNLKKANVISE